jgi:hypothetical protein
MRAFSNLLTEYSPQMEFESASPDAFAGEFENEVFDEQQEMELAVGLLETANEEQLELFLDNLVQLAHDNGDTAATLDIRHAVRDVLKASSLQVLLQPVGQKGSALGVKLGRGLADVAGRALGLELEGLSGEDREFEAARQFVRFAGETAKLAAAGKAFSNNPFTVAQHAAARAARTYAPGLLNNRRQRRGQRRSSGP